MNEEVPEFVLVVLLIIEYIFHNIFKIFPFKCDESQIHINDSD